MKPLQVNSWVAYQKAMDSATCRVAVDAGGNDGGYTHTLLVNGFGVHVFEPVPVMCDMIRARFKDDDKPIFINQLGLSDKRETLHNVTVLECWTIGKVGDGGLSVKPEMKDSPPFTMHTIPLDDYLGNTRIGLLKLDTDGYEFKVLRGAEKTLRRDKPPILCEFGKYISALGEKPEDFVNFIFRLGYDVWSCDGENKFTSWAEIDPQWPWNTTFDVMLLPR